MTAYILQRLLYNAFVLLGVSAVVFGLTFLTGDPASTLLPLNTPREDIDLFRHQMGYDRPMPVQYMDFLSKAVQGDFGMSLRHRQPALPIVLERLPATLRLALAGIFFSLIVSVPLGLLAGMNKGTWIDSVTRVVVLLGQVVPGFWLAIVLILVFGVNLRWLPVSGSEGWESLILPGFVVGTFSMASTARLLRSSLLEVLSKDYIRTAHAKGLRGRNVLLRHALKNAAIPVVTLMALQVGNLLGGAVIAEVVFAYPGMGRLAVQAITNRDVAVVQAFVALSGAMIVTTNLLLDIVYTWLDPRIRFA
ncbi:MAG: ABC transporter permease [Chloroflexi bacterium]|nr:ABC transporter permease [Chloroflexota bacterium]